MHQICKGQYVRGGSGAYILKPSCVFGFIARHLWNGIQSMHNFDILEDGRVQLPKKRATSPGHHDVHLIVLL